MLLNRLIISCAVWLWSFCPFVSVRFHAVTGAADSHVLYRDREQGDLKSVTCLTFKGKSSYFNYWEVAGRLNYIENI